MKKYKVLIFLSLFLSIVSFGQKEIEIELKNKSNTFKVLEQKNSGFEINTSISHLNLIPVKTKTGDFISLEVDGLIKSFDVGKPNIPISNRPMVSLQHQRKSQGKQITFIMRPIKCTAS